VNIRRLCKGSSKDHYLTLSAKALRIDDARLLGRSVEEHYAVIGLS
jgi:hypothetical protein